MNLQSKPVWTVQIDHDEFLLISRALRCVLKPEEIEPAKTLGDEMSVLKAKQGSMISHENEKLIENLRRAGLWS